MPTYCPTNTLPKNESVIYFWLTIVTFLDLDLDLDGDSVVKNKPYNLWPFYDYKKK